MSDISKALVAGARSALQLAGSSITYNRPGSGSVSITAIPGESTHEVERDGAIIDEVRSRDFLVVADDLVIGGEKVTPDRHDTITEDGVTYTVLALGGEAHWRWTDPTQAMIRIHTKRN